MLDEDELEPLVAELPVPLVPAVDDPGWLEEPLPMDAFVSVQLPSEPDRHPVTVTDPADLVSMLLLLDCEPLVPLVLGVVLWPLVLPLCAATLTAKAQASATPDAVVTSRFMSSLLLRVT